MAFGDCVDDSALAAAWDEFCESVRKAGSEIFKEVNPAAPVDRASGFRYLTQNLSQAFDMWLENADTTRPYLHAFNDPLRMLGADNADCIYHQSWINDTDTYRISGNLGTARMFNIAVQGPWKGELHEPFGDTPFANIFGDQLEVSWDRHFELYLSPDPHAGNWIQTKLGTRKIFYRQYFDHWDETPADFRIERIGPSDPPDPLVPMQLIEAMGKAGRFVYECVSDWPDTLFRRSGNLDVPNQFVPLRPRSDDGEESSDTHRGRTIQHMYWDLPENDAIIIEFDADPTDFWQMTNNNLFGGSMDFRYRQVNLTSGMTPTDGDGRTRLVMCRHDPGYQNWIDTQGHARGWLLFRDVQASNPTELTARTVKVDELERRLPSAPTVTPDERAAELTRRAAAVRRRYKY